MSGITIFRRGDVMYIELFMYDLFILCMTASRFNKLLVMVSHVFSISGRLKACIPTILVLNDVN